MCVLRESRAGRILTAKTRKARKKKNLTFAPFASSRFKNPMTPTQLTEQTIVKRLRHAEENSTNSETYKETDFPLDAKFRCAAVLIPLSFFQDEWHVLFTRRT